MKLGFKLFFILHFLFPVSLLAQESVSLVDEEKTMIWPDGTIYLGSVIDGKKEGEGVIFWKDGTLFEGYFENDKRNGLGTMTLPDGTVYTGEFRDDVLVNTETEPSEVDRAY